MNLEHLDPKNPADAMLLQIEELLKTPVRGPLRPKTLFHQELHDDNWNMEEQDDIPRVQRDVHIVVHDSFSVDVSEINPADISPDEHDEHMQHLLDMQLSREFENFIAEEEEEEHIRRPLVAMRRDDQPTRVFTIPQQQQEAPRPPRPAFEIYVPDDSVEELNASTSLSVLDDGKRSRFITLKGMGPLRVKLNPVTKTRAAVSAFALKIITIPDSSIPSSHVAIRTWFPRIDDNANIDRGVTFTFEHTGSSYGRRFPGLLGVEGPVFPRQSVAPFHPPVGLFTLHASMFPSAERYARETGDGMPGVNSIFLMPPGSFVTVLSPLDSRFLQTVDHVVLELEYAIHGNRQTLMRLAVNKAVFAGLLYYNQRTVAFAGVPVTESMHVDIKLRVRVRQKTKGNDQVLIVAVEKAEFTVPYGFEGMVREQQIVTTTTTSPK